LPHKESKAIYTALMLLVVVVVILTALFSIFAFAVNNPIASSKAAISELFTDY